MSDTLTLKEKACNDETWKHIHRVRELIGECVSDLLGRANNHDQSKLESPEVELFTQYTSQLAAVTYGSEEYEQLRKKLAPALEHHYAKNSHHPEHYKNGINDMNLLDLVEMFCDWTAATERHNDGNIRKSIEKNGDRFKMDPQLVKIFENTVEMFE